MEPNDTNAQNKEVFLEKYSYLEPLLKHYKIPYDRASIEMDDYIIILNKIVLKYIKTSEPKIIDNIKHNLENNLLNETVAIDDPVLTEEELDKLINKYYKLKENKIKYNIDKKAVDALVKTSCKHVYDNIEIIGLENLDDILNFAEIVNNAPVEGLDITIGANEAKNVFRKDEVKVFGDTESLLQNAETTEQNMFKIPKVIN